MGLLNKKENNMMNNYLGVKKVRAKLMTKGQYNELRGWNIPDNEEPTEEGYLIEYVDSEPNTSVFTGYITWSPKDVFEKYYFQIENENTISGRDIDNFIASSETIKIAEKTSLTTVKLINGFELIESSSCVDPKNFCLKTGENISLNNIKNKIWNHLGFLLQTAHRGLSNEVKVNLPKQAVLVKADDWEALYVEGVLVEEGESLNEGTSRIKYFVELSKIFKFNLEDLKEVQLEDEEKLRDLDLQGNLPPYLEELGLKI